MIQLFKKFLILTIATTYFLSLSAQKKDYSIASIGFYNLENIFDTIDTPDVSDSEFTPAGAKVWNTDKYYKKMNNMAEVISHIGDEHIAGGPYILGVCEIENRSVLVDLVDMPQLKPSNYGIVHYDSPDYRGVDVGLLYRKDFFEVTNSRSVRLVIDKGTDTGSKTGDREFKTRDQLVVSGKLNDEMIHIIVNHWPSRRGGEKRSRPLREAAAALSKSIADSIYKTDANAKIIIMGDLNDDPTNTSVKKIIGAKGTQTEVQAQGFFNPMYEKYQKGIGTGAYRDSWSLFDQMLLSHGLLGEDKTSYKFWKAQIYKKPDMIQTTGQYEGYPLRTFVGDTFMNGYSDHFPVYLFLIREK